MVRRTETGIRAGSVVLFFAIWEVVARVFDLGIFMVPPSEVWRDLWEWVKSGDIFPHLRASLIEVTVAFSLAVIAGVTIGLAIGFSRLIANLVEPTIAGMYSTPLLALTPLFVVWLGIGMASKIAIIFFVVVFPVIINTSAGAREIDPSHVELIRAFGGSKFDLIWRVRLPAAVPFIVASMRIGISRAIVGVFVAELFGAREGIGYSIQLASSSFDIPRIWSGVAVLAVLGIVASSLMTRLEYLVAPWRRHRNA